MKKFAFLTGINQYGLLPILKYARQDAEAVAQAIQKNYQFIDSEITLMTDQQKGFLMPMNKQVIENRLQELEGTNPDLFIFGFWGHGFFEKQLYFCPMGVSRETVVQDGFAMSRLIELIGNIGAKNAFLILDCCQSEATRGGITAAMSEENEACLVNAARDIGLRLKQRAPELPSFVPNIAILNSCKVGQSAYEWDEREHGIFTAHLLDAFGQGLDSVGKITDLLGRQVSITANRLGHNQQPFFQLQGSITLPVVERRDGKIYVRLPDRAEDMKILEPTIDDINITVVPVGPTEAQSIASAVIQLPPIPSELVQLRSEIAGIDEAIERLQAGNHPALAQAQQAIQTAQAQVESLAQKKSEASLPFQQTGGDVRQLDAWAQLNPKIPARQARILCPPTFDATRFVNLVIWVQQGELARRELTRVQEQYKQKRTECIRQLNRRKEQRLADQENSIKQLQESAILAILAVLPGYNTLSAALPERELVQLLPELNKYEMNWDSWGLIDLAAALWNEKRPGVAEQARKKRAEEEKRRQAEQIRKKREEEEEERRQQAVRIRKEREEEKRRQQAEQIRKKREKDDIRKQTLQVQRERRERDRLMQQELKEKRFLYSVLAICVFVLMFFVFINSTPVVKPAPSVFLYEGCFNGIRISGLIDESLENIYIPEYINDQPVVQIGDHAFSDCRYLTHVTIPSKVSQIGDYAFSECDSLSSVSIPSNVTKIGEWAFSGCRSLPRITIPSNINKIEDGSFSNCVGLVRVTIPSSVTEIGNLAFEGCCGLSSVSIPISITKIGEKAFFDCPDLTIETPRGSYAEQYAKKNGIKVRTL